MYSPDSLARVFAASYASVCSSVSATLAIIEQKPRILPTAAARRPKVSRSSAQAAPYSEVPFACAAAARAASDVSPMPRAGLFTARLKDSSSFVFAASLK